ncbi:MAG TPA: lytic transglycosylase domain-containing protein [Candidatus Limnocylindria bacterium]|nr:lytic transglycosylase domain-containing protein [Candidatus Limnocylindria bacterium]
MKLPLALAVVALLPATVQGQAQLQLDDALKLGEQWVRANVDPKVLQSLPQLDEKQAVQLLLQFQQQFQGEYVIDVVRLKQVANLALPFIERDEALKPYAPWLRSRMDYFEVARQLSLVVPPPPKAVPGQAAPPRANPTPQQQQQAWTSVVATEPWPASAKRYVPQLKPIFVSERVPAELVWLAEVESSFEPKAKSPAGAAGLYQLMPETAKREGLSLVPSDQRLDPGSSARASARYLHTLHGQFKDWPLTLAAYNAGEGRVRSLMTKYKATTFDGIAPHLPAETQMYVPKINAVIQRREGKSLAKL